MKRVTKQILLRFGSTPFLLGLIFFLPAGSFRFWQAWLYLGVLLLPISLAVVYFLRKDPELLERRMRLREKEREQSLLIKLSSLFFLAGFLLPGFDFRYQWSHVPLAAVLAADGIVLAGYGIFLLVMKENSFLSRTVEVEEGQKLITTGPYAVVRHPMYSGVMLMYFFTPIALGSWWALIPFIPLPFFLALRIINEEKILVKGLTGYEEYRRRVPSRMIPHIW